MNEFVDVWGTQLTFESGHSLIGAFGERLDQSLVAAPGLPVGIGKVRRVRRAHPLPVRSMTSGAALLINEVGRATLRNIDDTCGRLRPYGSDCSRTAGNESCAGRGRSRSTQSKGVGGA